jgi:hypothetical protein
MTEVIVTKTTDGIYVNMDGEKLGRVEYISLPPFVEKLLSSKSEVVRRKQVTVIARREEAMAVMSSTPGATLREVENGRATISVPI